MDLRLNRVTGESAVYDTIQQILRRNELKAHNLVAELKSSAYISGCRGE